jgi:acyl-CoA thioesterase
MMMDKLRLARDCAEQMFRDDQASRDLGMTVNIVEPGVAEVRMTVSRNMVNGHNVCHGGFVFSVADSAFAFACNCYDDVTVASGADINYLYPAKLDDVLVATARETHRGRRSGVYDVEVRNQDDRLIAVFSGRSVALGRPLLPGK